MKSTTGILQDFKINVKIKLSALWAGVMFCYVYGDFFGLFTPNRIQNLMNGNSGVGKTTPVFLLMFALLMAIPSVMIFLSVMLKPVINRWANIITGVFFTVVMLLVVSTSISNWMLYYTFLGIVEIIITIVIVYHAWRWPRQ